MGTSETSKKQENVFSRVVSLTGQILKENFKSPIGSLWYGAERNRRNMEVLSGSKTLEEANHDMQVKKDRSPLKILTNFLSGNPARQDRAIESVKGLFGNFLSGKGAGAQLIPAIAGLAGSKLGGFGNVTSIVIAALAALVVPMIMRAIQGSKPKEIPANGMADAQNELKKPQSAEQKQQRTREQSVSKKQEVSQGAENKQELERPTQKLNVSAIAMNEKQMMGYVREKGIVSLRNVLGASNPSFISFIKHNGLETALKNEEMGVFNGEAPSRNLLPLVRDRSALTTPNIEVSGIKSGIGMN